MPDHFLQFNFWFKFLTSRRGFPRPHRFCLTEKEILHYDLIKASAQLCLVQSSVKVRDFDLLQPLGSGVYSQVYRHVNRKTNMCLLIKKFSHDPYSYLEANEISEKLREFFVFSLLYPSAMIGETRLRFALDYPSRHPINPRITLPLLGEMGFSDLNCNIMIPSLDLFEKKVRVKKWIRAFSSLFHLLIRLHNQGIAHLDIKKENIRSIQEGVSFLIDFGNSLFQSEFCLSQYIERTTADHKPLSALQPASRQNHDYDIDYFSLANVLIASQGYSFSNWAWNLYKSDVRSGVLSMGMLELNYNRVIYKFLKKFKSHLIGSEISVEHADQLIDFLKIMSSQSQVDRHSLDVHAAAALLNQLALLTASELAALYEGGRKDFRGFNLEENINLSGFKLVDANLAGLNLVGANLIRANLNGAKLDGALLSDAKVSYSSLGRDQFEKLYAAGIRDFSGVKLMGADWSGLNFSDAHFEWADLREVDLIGVNLTRVNLKGAHLKSTRVRSFSLSDELLMLPRKGPDDVSANSGAGGESRTASVVFMSLDSPAGPAKKGNVNTFHGCVIS